MKITNATLRWFLVNVLSVFAAISVGGCSDKAAVQSVLIVDHAAPPAACEIVGFYGAPNNGGTFVRTVKQAPVKLGDAVRVTGTGFYDGEWTVLETLRYQDDRDPRQLWGYRIEPKWQGYPPGFIDNDGFPVRNAAKLQPLPAR
jgi:hypothetical protein